jgi:predicted Zn-dependent peptidase
LAGIAETTLLENGIRIVTESNPAAVSTAVGLWIQSGSRDEDRALNGAAHFLEHLVFKGTDRRSAFAIADEIERLGGSINGFTTKEYTCYHTRTLSAHVSVAVDVLSDLVRRPVLRAADVEIERDVILQEILDAEDSPEDHVHDYFLEQYWPGHPLGWPVLGSRVTLANLDTTSLRRFLEERYRPDGIILAAAGGVRHDEFVELSRRHFLDMVGTAPAPHRDKPDFSPGVFAASRDVEQVHAMIGFPGLAVDDHRREVADVMIMALGGGMSSRLFQRVREERGLAYDVYAFQSGFRDIGYTGIYAATSREHLADTVDLVRREIEALARDGLVAEELERTKSHLVGSIPLMYESTESQMFRVARNQLYHGREIPLDEVVVGIEKVTPSDVVELAREIFSFERFGIALVGDTDGATIATPAV